MGRQKESQGAVKFGTQTCVSVALIFVLSCVIMALAVTLHACGLANPWTTIGLY